MSVNFRASSKDRSFSRRLTETTALVGLSMVIAPLAVPRAVAQTITVPTGVTTNTTQSLGAGESLLNNGTISNTSPAVDVDGVAADTVTNNGLIAASDNTIRLDNGADLTGGITNNSGGTISGDTTATIQVRGMSDISGGITNNAGGTISLTSFGSVISVMESSDISGGISNSGTIVGNGPTAAIKLTDTSDISGGITNNAGGVIQGLTSAIQVRSGSDISGGITNSAGGLIQAQTSGITVLFGADISGGITNDGTIRSNLNGALTLVGDADISGGITNNAGGLFQAVTTGIRLVTNSDVSGGIVNSGRIIGQSGFGIHLLGQSDISGGITNNAGGVILGGAGIGIRVQQQSDISGGIRNFGTIQGQTNGIRVIQSDISGGIVNHGTIFATSSFGAGISTTGTGSDISGGVTNTGTIRGVSRGISVTGTADVTGGVMNTGLIVGDTGIFVNASSFLSGGVVNAGAIVGRNGTAISFSPADDSLTLLSGSTFSGLVDFGAGTNALNVNAGGLIVDVMGAPVTDFNLAFGAGITGATTDLGGGVTRVASVDSSSSGVEIIGEGFVDVVLTVQDIVQDLGGLGGSGVGTAFRNDQPYQVADASGRVPRASASNNRRGFWGQGFGGRNTRNTDGDASVADSRTIFYGGLGGADIYHRNGTLAGVFAGYAGDTTDVTDGAQFIQELESDRYFAGAYGAIPFVGGWRLQAQAFGGIGEMDSQRLVQNGLGFDRATAEDIDQTFLSVGISSDKFYQLGGSWTHGLKPSIGVSYNAQWINGYAETGSLAPLTVDDRSLGTVSEFAELAYIVEGVYDIEFETRLGAEGRHRVGDGSATVSLFGSSLDVATLGNDNTVDVYLGAGARKALTDTISFFADVEGRAGTETSDGVRGQGGFKVAF